MIFHQLPSYCKESTYLQIYYPTNTNDYPFLLSKLDRYTNHFLHPLLYNQCSTAKAHFVAYVSMNDNYRHIFLYHENHMDKPLPYPPRIVLSIIASLRFMTRHWKTRLGGLGTSAAHTSCFITTRLCLFHNAISKFLRREDNTAVF